MYAAARFLAYLLGSLAVAAGVYLALARGLFARETRALPGVRRALLVACALLPVGMLQLLFMRETPRLVAQPLMTAVFAWVGVLLFLLPAAALTALLRRALAAVSSPAETSSEAPPRRAFFRRALLATPGLGAGAVSVVGTVEAAREPALVRVRVEHPRWPAARAGYRVVQLSDLHVGPTLGEGFVRALVDRANALDADLVVLTGDLVDGSVAQLGPLLAPLGALRARDGVYFVTGNHEYLSGGREWVAFVQALGITVLRNEHRVLGDAARGDAFVLAGVDDDDGPAWFADHGPDFDRAFAGVARDAPVVLLAHRPTAVYAAARRDVLLQLSGHTHGGQVRPLHWLEGPYVAGPYVRANTALYISEGSGFWGPPMRVGTRSELTLLELRAGPAVRIARVA